MTTWTCPGSSACPPSSNCQQCPLTAPRPDPCRVYSHGADGWHCSVEGVHTAHRNAQGDAAW